MYIMVWKRRKSGVRVAREKKLDSTAWGERRRTVDGIAAAMATFKDRRESACGRGLFVGLSRERSGSDCNKE
jgi:hypothetical protein